MEQNNIEAIIKHQREFFLQGRTKDVDFRWEQLKRLKSAIIKNQKKIQQAIYLDLNKSETESFMTEIGMMLTELTYAIKHIKSWTKDRCVLSPLSQFPSLSFVKSEPFGVTLIMSPWNYPFLLCMEPLIGAIAAGNCCVIKPSNYAPNTSAAIRELITECFPSKYIATIEGGREVNGALLEQKFDYIFFTGGVTVGKLVMEKAAQHLTPVTLELGGKSPCIVDASANIKMAAKRIVFGKFLNAGQTCIAPDYVLIHESVKKEFIHYATIYIRKMFGENALTNKNYPKIINHKHYERVMSLIESDQVVIGGVGDESILKIQPTILDHVTGNSPVMQEEIFGPVLPVIAYRKLSEAEQFILNRPKPLACYIFTMRKSVERRLLRNLSFGGGCINDTIIHIVTSKMQFGGVGESGMGSYHGKHSFDTFSHKKSIVKRFNRFDFPIRYQPYSKLKARLIRMFLH